MYARMTFFDGPRSPELIAAGDRGSRERIEPALAARPDILADVVASFELRQPDGGLVMMVIAHHLECLDKALEVIRSTPLLPDEDPALLPGPDRIETYEVSRTNFDMPQPVAD